MNNLFNTFTDTWTKENETVNLLQKEMLYLTIIPRVRVGYEMIDSQRGA